MMENITAYEITGLIYGIGLGLFFVFACKVGINKLKAWFNKPVATNVNYEVSIFNDNNEDSIEGNCYFMFDTLALANQFIETAKNGIYSDLPILELTEYTYNSSDTVIKEKFLLSYRLGNEIQECYIISDRPIIKYNHC